MMADRAVWLWWQSSSAAKLSSHFLLLRTLLFGIVFFNLYLFRGDALFCRNILMTFTPGSRPVQPQSDLLVQLGLRDFAQGSLSPPSYADLSCWLPPNTTTILLLLSLNEEDAENDKTTVSVNGARWLRRGR